MSSFHTAVNTALHITASDSSTSSEERCCWVSVSNLYTQQGTPALAGLCIYKIWTLTCPYALKKAANYLYFPFRTATLGFIRSKFPCGTWTGRGTARGISDTLYLRHLSFTRCSKLQKCSRTQFQGPVEFYI